MEPGPGFHVPLLARTTSSRRFAPEREDSESSLSAARRRRPLGTLTIATRFSGDPLNMSRVPSADEEEGASRPAMIVHGGAGSPRAKDEIPGYLREIENAVKVGWRPFGAVPLLRRSKRRWSTWKTRSSPTRAGEAHSRATSG